MAQKRTNDRITEEREALIEADEYARSTDMKAAHGNTSKKSGRDEYNMDLAEDFDDINLIEERR
jgi:hypothetical protein